MQAPDKRSHSKIRSVGYRNLGKSWDPRHGKVRQPPAESPGGEIKAVGCLARLPVNSNNHLAWAPDHGPVGGYVARPDSVIVPSITKYVHLVPLAVSHLVTECVMPSHPTNPSQDERSRAGFYLLLCFVAGMRSGLSTTHICHLFHPLW